MIVTRHVSVYFAFTVPYQQFFLFPVKYYLIFSTAAGTLNPDMLKEAVFGEGAAV